MEVVGRMAREVAHDLNNLLTIISGNADLLLEENTDERLQHIRNAAVVGATLTSQLLAFSRQSLVKPVTVDLNTAVHEMVQILGRLLGKGIQIRLEMGIESALILADRGQVQQIILNLAVNARDAMPGGGQLIFTTEESFGPPKGGGVNAEGHEASLSQRWVELSVKDTDIGMDASIRARAFEPFFTTKEPGKGTGLGLSTVQDIVAQNAGTIHIGSQPGAGTKVTLRFPRQILSASQVSPSVLENGNKPPLAALQPDAKPNIMLEEGPKIDLLIADMSMPGKSGLDLAKGLVSQKQSLKTLFISGYSPSRNSLANSAFLQKPFTRNELLSAVNQLHKGSDTSSGDGDLKKEKARLKLVPFPKSPPTISH